MKKLLFFAKLVGFLVLTSAAEARSAYDGSCNLVFGGSRDRTKSPAAVSRKREYLRSWPETLGSLAVAYYHLSFLA